MNLRYLPFVISLSHDSLLSNRLFYEPSEDRYAKIDIKKLLRSQIQQFHLFMS